MFERIRNLRDANGVQKRRAWKTQAQKDSLKGILKTIQSQLEAEAERKY